MGETKFSIIIPAFNVAPYIGECIKSALDQTYGNFEVIVIDDCSTDATTELVEAFSDSRIRLLTNGTNQGVSRTRNVGIDRAEGEYVVLLDSDDTIWPGRLEALNNAIERDQPDLLFDDLLYQREGRPATGVSAYSQRNILPTDVDRLTFNDFISKDLGILHGTFRKAFVADRSLRFEEEFRIGEDFVFYAEMFLLGAKAAFLPEAMYLYRQRRNSLISTQYADYYADLLATSTHLLAKYEEELNALPRTKSLLQKRMANHATALGEYRVKGSLKHGNFSGALSLIVKDPSIGVRLGKTGLNKLRASMSR